jgi:hypothetical protein
MKSLYKVPLFYASALGIASLLFTGCKSTDIAGRYTSKHIKANTNQVVAQVPELNELGYIILSLTDAAKNDTTLINKNTSYYAEIQKHFGAFKKHKAVKQLDKELSLATENISRFRNGLYAYQFNDRDNMVLKIDYRTDLNKIDFRRLVSSFEDFAEKTKYRDFYKQHSSLYNQLAKEQSQQLTMSATWAVMGKQYTQPFQSYQVIISPLMKGEAKTLAVSGRGFRECFIFTDSNNKVLLFSANKTASRSVTTDN